MVKREAKKMEQSKLLEKIQEIFEHDHGQMRSVGGIARDVGLSKAEIESFIHEHQKYFTRAPIRPGGYELYRLNPDGITDTK